MKKRGIEPEGPNATGLHWLWVREESGKESNLGTGRHHHLSHSEVVQIDEKHKDCGLPDPA
jgi:hypothetical protein